MSVTREQVAQFLNTSRGSYLMGKALHMATTTLMQRETRSDEVNGEIREMNIVMGTLFPLFMEVHDPAMAEALQKALSQEEGPGEDEEEPNGEPSEEAEEEPTEEEDEQGEE